MIIIIFIFRLFNSLFLIKFCNFELVTIINKMHELSIVMGIVKIAEDETAKVKENTVAKIELEIGQLAGVELDALNFVWESAVKDSVLEQALKTIIEIPGKAICADCDCEFYLNNIFDSCPNCNSNFKGIIQGKELRVKSLEVI